MIPRFKPSISYSNIFKAMFYRADNVVEKFEKKFAKLAEQKFSVAFPYGRTALLALLSVLNIKNKRIICPAYTCVVVAHAIIKSGNIPVFVDCEKNGYNMDLSQLENLIDDNTAAIIATSIFGIPINLDVLKSIKNKYKNIYIFQDCAHSFFAEWKGEKVNIVGDAAFYGMNISKIFSCVFGGMVTTNNEFLYKKLKCYYNQLTEPLMSKNIYLIIYVLLAKISFSPLFYGITKKLQKLNFLDRFTKYYDESVIDLPADSFQKITFIQAKIGLLECDNYQKIVKARREAASIYNEKLKNIQGFDLPECIVGCTYSHYPVLVSSNEKWIKLAEKKGVELGHLIEYCIPDMKAYTIYKADPNHFSIARSYIPRIINLPVSQGKGAAKNIVNILKRIENDIVNNG